MITRFKICGVRTPAGVTAAVAAGAAALGLNLYAPSPRSVTVDEAVALARGIPPFVSRVALFVNTPAAQIRAVATRVGADSVQLHGASVDDLAELRGFHRILAVGAVPGQTLDRLAPYLPEVDAVLLDAVVPGEHGGTGRQADWDEAAAVVAALDLPVILAGGLTPHNVTEAIAKVRPYAVDVASGVERTRGEQDPDLIAAFGAAVWRAS